MNQESHPLIVGVRFSKIGKNYYFNASHLNDIQVGDCIVVETSRGWQLGEVDEILPEINPSMKQNLKKIDRRATPADLLKKQELNLKEEEALSKCLQKQRIMNIRGLKIVTSEYGFDEKSISILFSSPEPARSTPPTPVRRRRARAPAALPARPARRPSAGCRRR